MPERIIESRPAELRGKRVAIVNGKRGQNCKGENEVWYVCRKARGGNEQGKVLCHTPSGSPTVLTRRNLHGVKRLESGKLQGRSGRIIRGRKHVVPNTH